MMNRRGVIGSLLGLVGLGGSAVAKEDEKSDRFNIKVCDVYGREFKKSDLDHYVVSEWDAPFCFAEKEQNALCSGLNKGGSSVDFLSPVDGAIYSCCESYSVDGDGFGLVRVRRTWDCVKVADSEKYYCFHGFTYDDHKSSEGNMFSLVYERANVVELKGYEFDSIVTRSYGQKYRKYIVKDSGVRS